MTILFANTARTDGGAARQSEPTFDYLERTARPPFAALRKQMQCWLDELPLIHRKELAKRLQSRDDHHFEAAFFELYLHALSSRLGFAVTLHPRAGGRGKRPDFLLRRGAASFLMEAATVGELSEKERAAQKRRLVIYDALNAVQCPDYFFHVEHYGEPATPIPVKALKREVVQFLGTVHYEDVIVIAALQELDRLPRMVFEHDGCRIEISLLPVSIAKRGAADHRPVGMIGPGDASWVDNSSPIRDKIRAKAHHYGKIRRPLVVAVNAAGRSLDQTSIMEALFGKETYVIDVQNGWTSGNPKMQRKPDGAWFGPRGPQNRRVSAVLVVSSLLPWTVTVHRPVVYHNPWAAYPLTNELDALESFRGENNRMVGTTGQSMSSILSLPEQWPFHIEDTV